MKSPVTPINESAVRLHAPPHTKSVVFVGFDAVPLPGIRVGILEHPSLHPVAFGDGDTALSYLHQRGTGYFQQTPFIIVCDMAFLDGDRGRFLAQVAAHPETKFVPLIALSADVQKVDKKRVLQMGIDDCFDVSAPWDMIERRAALLNQYKARFASQPAQAQHGKPYRTPPVKRVFDILSALLIITVSTPIWLLTAIAIKLESRGPVLYRSKRIGAGYQGFDFLKFRSMQLHADKLLDEYRYLNQYADGSSFVKISNDPRVTRVGKFIRKYSIDELPQLLNVLKGDMSIVGNRPLPVYEAETLTRAGWCSRFLAPAGITGLWQVTKRGKSDMSQEERIALDVAYAEERSLWLDLTILFKTPLAIIQKEHV
jgi:lipopolysaccharide/colanic/teichoic acid biosynthesis glycosyltransferase